MVAFVVYVALQSLCSRTRFPVSLASLPSVCPSATSVIGIFSFFPDIIAFIEAIFTSPKLSLQTKLFSYNNLPLTLLSGIEHPVSSI